ncbi:unnamed protein product [Caenorhabditis sp. 36 PRJEB53466]|nr:unnamed protein product [Caenorhabditis sp. 36 PRJEB53466]
MGRPSLLLLCLFSVSCLAEDNSHVLPVYKFGILAGEPTSLNGSTQAQVASFDECVDKCSEDSECIVASRDDGPCYLFKYDTITGVRKNESGGQGLVAFRVYTDQPSCDLNLPLLLNGKTYPLNANNTLEKLWRIDTTQDGWNITYIDSKLADNLICGNWTYNRPYADGCDPECLLTMTAVYAKPGPLAQKFEVFTGVQPSDWNACMQACHSEPTCIVVYWDDNVRNCTYHTIYRQPYFLNKTSAEDGRHAAIKMNLNNETCKYTTDQLLNDTYFMASQDVIKMTYTLASAKVTASNVNPVMPFYRVRNTGDYFVFNYYTNETILNMNNASGCPIYWEDSRFWSDSRPYQIACYQGFNYPNATQKQAKHLCERMNGRLMVESYRKFGMSGEGYLMFQNFGLAVWWGISCSTCNIWMGLERDEECVGDDQSTSYCAGNQQWQWSNPSWPLLWRNYSVTPPADIPVDWKWASGHPIISDDKLCAYMQKTPDLDKQENLFYSADCDSSTDVGGFVCAQDIQQIQGIPKYDDVARSYGYI